jgi:hypothetical protein
MLLIVSKRFQSRTDKHLKSGLDQSKRLDNDRNASLGGKVAWRCIGFRRAPLISGMQLSRSYLSQMTVVERQPP